MSFYPRKRHLCLPRAVQMRIGGKFAERLDPGAGLLMHNTCAGCHRWTRFIIAAPLAGPCGPRKWICAHLLLPQAGKGLLRQPNPIKRTLLDKVVLHHVSLRDDEAIVGFSANDPATHTSLVSCRGRERKRAAGRRLKPLSPSTSRPSLPLAVGRKEVFSCFQRSLDIFSTFSFQPGRFPCGSGRPGCR